MSQSPKRLPALIRVLQAQGGRMLLPSDRTGLHPLLIPLASDPAEPNQVTCLLRWPEPAKAKVSGEGMLPCMHVANGPPIYNASLPVPLPVLYPT